MVPLGVVIRIDQFAVQHRLPASRDLSLQRHSELLWTAQTFHNSWVPQAATLGYHRMLDRYIGVTEYGAPSLCGKFPTNIELSYRNWVMKCLGLPCSFNCCLLFLPLFRRTYNSTQFPRGPCQTLPEQIPNKKTSKQTQSVVLENGGQNESLQLVSVFSLSRMWSKQTH
jgi:hypothetical protein